MNELKCAWNWYVNLFSNPNDAVKIAAWATTLTTLTFLLTFLLKPLFKFFTSRFSKLKVSAGISHQIIQSAFGVNAGIPLLTCTILNKDNKAVYIQNPTLKLSKKINGDNKFIVPKQRGTFPMKLEAGQQIQLDYNTGDLYNRILQQLSSKDKVFFVVSLTTGKNYSSNKFSKKHIVEHINVAQTI
ncbi:hypothetical protein [Chitinophaga filiformis]|uniref:Uncharacterized protein n=1 Tax=Chitinophaga filiformis TaxID=104663 RepID=A0ABY4HVX1_CHIFI|nr:hypothetical protein [Chitinophaga filiformis]UPK67941.1 hypothetical protein MYF79_23600 [Chitinophaga filiformis]